MKPPLALCSWKGISGTEPFYEAWRLLNDSTLVNFSVQIKNSDTSVKESGALLLRKGQISLGQTPTRWLTTRLHKNELVSKNDTIRFSNTVKWSSTKHDHWFTILEHPKSTVYYDMTRDTAIDRKVTAWMLDRTKQKNKQFNT